VEAVRPDLGEAREAKPPGPRWATGARPTAVTRPTPLISIVLCTSGRRPAALARCLRSLSQLDGVSSELILVDNEPVQQIHALVLPGLENRVVHEPRRGLDVARNGGAAAARGRIVAFIDDDCQATHDWLIHIAQAFTDPSVALVTGRVLPANLHLDTAQWFEARFSFDRGNRPRRFQRGDCLPWFPLHPWQLGTGCNMAVRRDVLARIGWFDPSLDMGSLVGGGGDLDLFRRILDAGETAVYEPRALIRHYHRVDRASLGRQFFGYGATVTALAVKGLMTRQWQRRETLSFVRWYLRDEWRRLRSRWHGDGEPVPLRMFACEMAGHAWGPIGYLAGRARSGKVATPGRSRASFARRSMPVGDTLGRVRASVRHDRTQPSRP
jgi:glycosyltransferase involved in cell wall biosynthesis